MKRCKNCGKKIINENPKAHNLVYCDKNCANEWRRKNPSPSHTKEAVDKRNHEKYNKKADGKFQCPYCGGWYWALLRHVWQIHDVNEKEFKLEFGLKASSSFIQERERQIKRESIKEHQIIPLLLKNGMKTRIKKGQQLAPKKRRTKMDYREA